MGVQGRPLELPIIAISAKNLKRDIIFSFHSGFISNEIMHTLKRVQTNSFDVDTI